MCTPSPAAYSVGAVIVSGEGNELATGYSRETEPHQHAEEAALAKLAADDPRLLGESLTCPSTAPVSSY